MATMPHVIAIIQEKGGAGKSTLATNLAAVAAKAGERVCIIDLDGRANAISWLDRYNEAGGQGIDGLSLQIGRLPQEVAKQKAAGKDLIIIDTRAQDQHVAVEAARLADLVLCPCPDDPFYMEGLAVTASWLRMAGSPPSFVLWHSLHPFATRSAEALKAETLELFGIPACPVHCTVSKEISTAKSLGLAPGGRAGAEFEQVHTFICAHLNNISEGGQHVACG